MERLSAGNVEKEILDLLRRNKIFDFIPSMLIVADTSHKEIILSNKVISRYAIQSNK
jgi:hypothetical protein